eukprot:TRINITY_DN28106_c0_g1_i2.p1 TRINITY_DN28106_c0_g1~~TRINITY_DN28106_c0_g1_i2.p1  ORF type:complete len:995 (-),score=205.04 TRINITY_DN28106_c0_g1_i2:63-3047(-)
MRPSGEEAARLDAVLDAALSLPGQSARSADGVVVPREGSPAASGSDDVVDEEVDIDVSPTIVDGDDADDVDESMLQPETPSISSGIIDRSDNIRVFVRVRPANVREGSAPRDDVVKVDGASNSVHLLAEPPRSFAFDGVLDQSGTQEDVFNLVGKTVGEFCLSGYNGSIYVYGQTGSGKTHTMQGSAGSVHSMVADEKRGVMCRILEHVFDEVMRRHQEDDSTQYKCKCSYLEIYKEQITDLLEVGVTNLQVREDINRGIYVERLSEQSVWTLADATHALWKGFHQRHVGATQMNEKSSRSHAVFTLIIEATSTTSGGVTSTRIAKLNLIDLAGSERQSFDPNNPTQLHESVRVKEAGSINRSLSALTNVIMSLSNAGQRRRPSMGAGGSGRRPFVRYRDSKLTFLLRDSLGGNSKTVIIACVSPSALCFGETLSTLKFAARAKHIRCAAVMNEEYSGTVESLMLEVKSLKQQLELLQSRGLVPGATGTVSQASFVDVSGAAGGALAGDGSPRRTARLDAAREDEQLEKIIKLLGAGGEDIRRLYGPRRVRRLEILLAAALERERRCELKRHKLEKFTQFLNGLLERKEMYFDALRDYFAFLVDHAYDEACFPPDIMARLTLFRHQLSTAGGDKNRVAVADMLDGSDCAQVEESGSQADLLVNQTSASVGDLGLRAMGVRPGAGTTAVGVGSTISPASPRSQSHSHLATSEAVRRGRGTSQSLQLKTYSSSRLLRGEGGSTFGLSGGGAWFAEGEFVDEELQLLRCENRLLRRQVESHPQLYRLATENRLLREHLASVVQQHALARDDPPLQKGHKQRRRAMDGFSDDPRPRGAPREAPQGLSREQSLKRSPSALLGQASANASLAEASRAFGVDRQLPMRRFDIEGTTQISSCSSSAESEVEDASPAPAMPTPESFSGSLRPFGGRAGGGSPHASAKGASDAASFLPNLAREVEELLRTKDSLESALKQVTGKGDAAKEVLLHYCLLPFERLH